MERPFEAIVLAGGLGARLRNAVPDRPKAMVEVAGRPFLEILLDRMSRSGFAKIVLATGHLHEVIERHFGYSWAGMELVYSVEDHPLGTGGAAWQALKLTSGNDVFLINGDTFFAVDFAALHRFHRSLDADVTLALKPMKNFDRYGTVELKDGRITGFREKAKTDEGLINGGIYLLNRQVSARLSFPERFSIETDFLEKKVGEISMGGFVQDGYFIDIGIPDDYTRAQWELPRLKE